ncbi:hypothetical protein [Emticicia sp. 17c]|uniref:hypothetical protein n=1 Tax=Emticicia sp. 17c TaxID=3127704 RepID=UPI00301C6B7E
MPPPAIKVDFEVRGANWGVFGIMKVGKSYFTKLLALRYYLKGKRVIILDHNHNDDTYDDFWGISPTKVYQETFHALQFELVPSDVVMRIQRRSTSEEFDFSRFFHTCSTITDSVFILDDLGDVFGNQATAAIKNFPGTVINNRNEAFYQFHRLYQAHPFLRDKLQMLVLKSLPTDAPIPEDFVMPAGYIRQCLQEIEAINLGLPFKKKFAWRILNMYDSLVLVPEKIYTDGRPEKTNTYEATEYFKRK